MDLYRKVRLACAEGMSQREAARHFGISRDSVRKILAFSVPPWYRRSAPIRRPEMDGFTGIIDQWVSEDRKRPRKQRHTAKRIFERLRDVHGFAGDELGFVPLGKTGAELLFELISQRYERGFILITSSLPFEEWKGTFGSERLTGALLDRLAHQVSIPQMNGDSYRLAQSRARRNS